MYGTQAKELIILKRYTYFIKVLYCGMLPQLALRQVIQQCQYRRDKETIPLILYAIQHGSAVLMYAQKGV